MSSFAALMALSADQTRQSDAAVQNALAERRRKEEARRRAQEEKEKKEKEREAKLRLKKLQEQKREEERQKRLEEETQAKEKERQRREEEQRQALMYGKKGGRSEYPSSSSQFRDELKRRRLPSPDDGSAGPALTREEKRKRRFEVEMRRAYASPRRGHGSGYSKAGKVLPGGAIDSVTASSVGASDNSHQSVKARLTAMPITLTKLNTVKRDTRTIDEILQDRAKARETKVIDGDQAREFNDWFGTSKKKEKELSTKKSNGSTPVPASSSGSTTPAARSSFTKSVSPTSSAEGPNGTLKKANGVKQVTMSASAVAAKTATGATPKSNGTAKSARPAPLEIKTSMSATKSSSASAKTPTTSGLKSSSSMRASTTSAVRPPLSSHPSSASIKKRPRSPSMSASPSPPPPSKRRAAVTAAPSNDLSAEIWKLFGKDRNTYMSRDIFSDDEDMEADARAVEREEARSSRIAKREEQVALEEERRHEEEKRRRKKERERADKRA